MLAKEKFGQAPDHRYEKIAALLEDCGPLKNSQGISNNHHSSSASSPAVSNIDEVAVSSLLAPTEPATQINEVVKKLRELARKLADGKKQKAALLKEKEKAILALKSEYLRAGCHGYWEELVRLLKDTSYADCAQAIATVPSPSPRKSTQPPSAAIFSPASTRRVFKMSGSMSKGLWSPARSNQPGTKEAEQKKHQKYRATPLPHTSTPVREVPVSSPDSPWDTPEGDITAGEAGQNRPPVKGGRIAVGQAAGGSPISLWKTPCRLDGRTFAEVVAASPAGNNKKG